MLSRFSPVPLCTTPWTVACVHGIPKARILEWVTMPSSSQVLFLTQGSYPHLPSPVLAGGFFTTSTTWEAQFCRINTDYSKLAWVKMSEKWSLAVGAYSGDVGVAVAVLWCVLPPANLALLMMMGVILLLLPLPLLLSHDLITSAAGPCAASTERC